MNKIKLIEHIQVQVMWRAPAPGSGCVVFTAMIMENQTNWFATEGKLMKKFCEMSVKETEQLDDLRCCACDEAKYKVRDRYYFNTLIKVFLFFYIYILL
jgi:hypothetical protein